MRVVDYTGTAKPAPYVTETEKLQEKYKFLEPVFKELKSKDGEETELKVTDCKVNASRLRLVLETEGFFNYDLAGSRFLLRLDNGAAEVWTIEQLRDWFDKEYIRTFPDEGLLDITKEMLENKFLNSKENLLKESITNRLRPPKEIAFLEHNQHTAYFPYKNGVAVVTKHGIKLIPYHQAEGIVFKNNILPRNFIPRDETDFKKGNWYQFLKNIANGRHNERQRIADMCTVIGYLLHRFYERKLKAIILMDSRGSADNPKGRGGKTLLGKGLGHMLNADMKMHRVYCELDGKNFDREKSSKYQEVDITTSLLHLNDVERSGRGKYNFNLTQIYNDVLEGIKVEKKFKDPFIVRCKMMISANHTFNTESGSTRDRFEEVQLSDCYDEKYSPYQEFGKWFFSTDWNSDDWANFDNAMLYCVKEYLRRGLCPPEAINLNQMKAEQESSPEFIKYMEELRATGEIYNGCEIPKADLMVRFLAQYPEHAWLEKKPKSWLRWLRAYTHYHDFLEDWTPETNDKFDTTTRGAQGITQRVFRYWWKEDYRLKTKD